MGLFSKRPKAAQREDGLGISRKYDLLPGKCDIVEESPPDLSFDAFVNILSTQEEACAKITGLAISRQHPDLIKQKYGLEKTPIFWLATRAGQDVIAPTNLGILTHTLISFIEDNSCGVVLLDGIEYLVSNNDFNKTLRAINQVNDHVAQSRCRIIIPVDPRAFDPKELALLERNAEKIMGEHAKRI
jgi:hypothetical protein